MFKCKSGLLSPCFKCCNISPNHWLNNAVWYAGKTMTKNKLWKICDPAKSKLLRMRRSQVRISAGSKCVYLPLIFGLAIWFYCLNQRVAMSKKMFEGQSFCHYYQWYCQWEKETMHCFHVAYATRAPKCVHFNTKYIDLFVYPFLLSLSLKTHFLIWNWAGILKERFF